MKTLKYVKSCKYMIVTFSLLGLPIYLNLYLLLLVFKRYILELHAHLYISGYIYFCPFSRLIKSQGYLFLVRELT